MYFTQDDFKKIHEWLKRNSVKDSEFSSIEKANLDDTITIVSNGLNRKITLKDFFKEITKELNVSEDFNIENGLLEISEFFKTSKQDALESGINIKTINNQSILGSGNIEVLEQGVDDVYNTNLGNLEMKTPVGGIAAGTTANSLKNKTFTELFDDLLFPSIDPTYSKPSVSGFDIKPSSTIVAINSNTPNITPATFNKGYWKEYNNNKEYAGNATSIVYTIDINDSTYNSLLGLPSTFTKVGDQIYSVKINYSAGQAPVNNKGVLRPSLAAPSGYVTKSITVNVTYPYYVKLKSNTTMTENISYCSVNSITKKATINIGAIGTLPSSSMLKGDYVFKVKGDLTKLEIDDAFNSANNYKTSLLEDLISEYDPSTGLTCYKYKEGLQKGEVTINNGIITFNI